MVSLGLVLVGLLWAGGMPLRYFGWFAGRGARRCSSLMVKIAPYRHGADHLVPGPVLRPHRRRLPGHPRHVRARHRRPVGCRPRQQRHEVEPAAARAVGLHLRDHRRGAGLPRLPRRRHPVRRARLRRLPHRPPLGRPVRPARLRRDHRLADRPGRDEHGLRRRPAAGHRCPAAADLRGRHLARADPLHRRPARPVRPLRARRPSRRSAAGPAAAWPGSSCRFPLSAVDAGAPAAPAGGAAPRPARRWSAAAGPSSTPAPRRPRPVPPRADGPRVPHRPADRPTRRRSPRRHGRRRAAGDAAAPRAKAAPARPRREDPPRTGARRPVPAAGRPRRPGGPR